MPISEIHPNIEVAYRAMMTLMDMGILIKFILSIKNSHNAKANAYITESFICINRNLKSHV